MKSIRYWIFGLLLALLGTVSKAQISGGGLPSYKDTTLAKKECLVQMPLFSKPAYTFSKNEGIRNKTLRFAHAYKVSFNPINSGSWTSLENGRKVWRLHIKSAGAKSLNVIFSKYQLPVGAQLFVFDKNRDQIRGSFTHINNKKSGVLPVMPVPGDHLIIEYQAPLSGDSYFELEVGAVNHDYVGILENKAGGVGMFGASGYCEIDVNCNESTEKYKRGIVKILTGGVEFSTGALVNNTAQDGTPYVLTAGHSYNAFGFDASTSLFIFNYEVPLCSTKPIEGTREHSIAGGTMRAMSPKGNNEDIDFSLVEMSVVPPVYYRPYYFGWDLSLNLESNVSCIHHPMGDVKKVSHFNGALVYSWLKISGDKDYYPNGHYLVDRWSLGTTEGGSSGAPLITADGYVLGGLSAGLATCPNPIKDYYYRFDKAWNVYSESSKHLKSWLDPAQTGLLKVAPYEPIKSKEIKRYSNVNSTHSITEPRLHGEVLGLLSGHNGYAHTAYADKFETQDQMELFGVYIMPNRMDLGTDSDVKISVWEGSDMPERLVYQQELKIKEWTRFQEVDSVNTHSTGGYKAKKIYANKENFILFNTKIVVKGNYFVGYELSYDAPLDTFSVYTAEGSAKQNTAYFKNQNEWSTFTQHPNLPGSYSLWVEPLGRVHTYNTVDDSSKKENFFDFYPNPVNNAWVTVDIKIEEEISAQLSVFSLEGKLLFKRFVSKTGKQKVRLPKLASGMYVISINTDVKSQSKLMVIE